MATPHLQLIDEPEPLRPVPRGATTQGGSSRLVGDIVTPAGIAPHHELVIDNGMITALRPATGTPTGRMILPGFADLHNHGGAGESFPTSDLEGCRRAARHHRRHGSTTLLASTVSEVEEKLLPQLRILAQLAQEGEITGIHAEGPFVNIAKCGAQNPAAIVPGDPRLFAAMIDAAGGYLRSVTLAPETANVATLVDMCAEHGIVVSLGHTTADFATTMSVIRYAADRGATVTATHLFNAMPPLHHRDPGAAAALISAAARGLAHVEIIADGTHLDDATVDMVLAATPHAIFVSDAMGAAGQSDGKYVLGGLDVVVRDGVARLATTDGSEGAIAGGTSRIIDQVQRQVRAGHDLRHIIDTATRGRTVLDETDTAALEVGAVGSCIVATSALEVVEVYDHGRRIEALEG